MSWYATRYAWKCTRHDAAGREQIKGTVKLVLLAIAYCIPKGSLESELLTLRQLSDLTGIQERQLRSCRDFLIRLGEVEQRGTSTAPTFAMPRMAGPLFAVDGPVKIAESSAKIAAAGSAKITGSGGKDCISTAGGVLSSGVLRTQVPTTTGRTAVAGQLVIANEFLDWWVNGYPDHNGGKVYEFKPERDGAIVSELLAVCDIERLKILALELWGVTRAEDAWIADSDRSVAILKHRRLWLEHRADGRQRRAGDREPWLCRHESECGNQATCAIKMAQPEKYPLRADALECPHSPRCSSSLTCENRKAHPERYAEASA